jgi:hypothetical protein
MGMISSLLMLFSCGFFALLIFFDVARH